VAAVFDAFLSIYQNRSRDLLRLASGGTGVLPLGELHPDLVNRLAQEAAKAAGHVLNICIRALDYCPPVDLTFGEYLRALITSDLDLMPDDEHRYRVAFIEAFRRRGIYPSDLRTLSEDSLRWTRPGEDPTLAPGEMEDRLRLLMTNIGLRTHVDRMRYLKTRREIWDMSQKIQGELHNAISNQVIKAQILQRLTGLALSEYSPPPGVRLSQGMPVFRVKSIREARRQKGDGRPLNQVFITLLQTQTMHHNGQVHSIRCGSVLIIDLDDERVTYVVRKGLQDEERLLRTIAFKEEQTQGASLRSTYFVGVDEPFAALHSTGA